jgi:hypothetical protein
MKRIPLIVSFAFGCLTAFVAGRMTTTLRAQTGADGPGVIHVCVASDGALRVTPPGTPCPAGQRGMFFKKVGSMGTPQAVSSGSSPTSSDARIRSLEQRVAALEGQAARTGLTRRVTAPLEIVDRNGRPVFSVGEDRVARLYNMNGKNVVRLNAGDTGGSVITNNAEGSVIAAMGATNTEANVKIQETAGSIVRAELGSGTTTNGTYRLAFSTKDGKSVAKIGQNEQGGGSAWVADANGIVRAVMSTTKDKKGYVSVDNAAAISVATLTEGEHGGVLALTDSGGEVMVDAGVLPTGAGVVRAGPGSFMMAAGVGLPGSFIMGKPK